MAEVTDPDGVTWSVRRWWWNTTPWETGFATLDGLIFFIMLPFLLMWPFWLASKWLGASWTIDIKRDGTKVGSEQVRGWRRSGQRVEELARAAQEGTLTQFKTQTEA
jgi:hypothetical protein